MGERPHLVIDPKVQFGRVCVPGTRIPAESLAEFVMAGDSVEHAAWAYDVTREDVLVSCWWELEQINLKAPSYRTKAERRTMDAWEDWWADVYRLPWSEIPDPPRPEGAQRQ